MSSFPTRRILLVNGLACLILSGCATKPFTHPEKEPAVKSAKEAADRLLELKNAGQLPGFAKTDHGALSSERFHTWDGQPEYPLNITFTGHNRSHKGKLYWYSMQKPTEDAGWQITEAWETNSRGGNRKPLSLTTETLPIRTAK